MSGDVGFIGIGAMGYPMAMNIRKKLPKDATLYINDVSEPALQKFVAEASTLDAGPVVIVSNAKEMAEKADTLLSIVPSAAIMKTVFLDSQTGVMGGLRDSTNTKLYMECSTIDVKSSREVGDKLESAGNCRFIDAPVSGGVPGAIDATLAFMIGLSESDPIASRVKAIISMMGRPDRIFFCGQPGAGLAAKIANNYLSGTNILAIAEAMNFGIRSGVEKKMLYKIIHESSGQSFMCDHVNPVPGVAPDAPSNRDYQGGFRTQMMVKDISLGIEAAELVGVRTTIGPAALEFYKEAAESPICMDRDVSVVYRYLGGPED